MKELKWPTPSEFVSLSSEELGIVITESAARKIIAEAKKRAERIVAPPGLSGKEIKSIETAIKRAKTSEVLEKAIKGKFEPAREKMTKEQIETIEGLVKEIREKLIAPPVELTEEQRSDLASWYAEEIKEAPMKGMPSDEVLGEIIAEARRRYKVEITAEVAKGIHDEAREILVS